MEMGSRLGDQGGPQLTLSGSPTLEARRWNLVAKERWIVIDASSTVIPAGEAR